MNKDNIKYIDVKSLLDYNGYTMKDFEGREYLRGRCPDCPSGKSPALSINVSCKYARCFRCGTIFINQGMHHEEVKELFLNTQIEEDSISGIRKYPDPMIKLLFEEVDPSGNEYLQHRNPHVKDWTKYGLGIDENSVFIPYYYMGRMIFYQIRYVKGERRYNMPSLPSPLYFPHEWDMNLPTIICEGPFDAIALDCAVGDDFNIVGLIGKELTKYKRSILSNLSTKQYYIMLDESELSEKLRKKNWMLNEAKIIPTSGDDPEEILNEVGMDKFINYIKEYTR